MIGISPKTAFYKPYVLPEPPAPPNFKTAPDTTKNPDAKGTTTPADKDDTVAKLTASIGLSPVIQAFLLRLQELGLTSFTGTDGNDKLNGWSGSLVDAGDGDDTVDVWSGSVVDTGAGDDSVRAWSESKVYGGAGNDTISAWSDSKVDGGDGNDQISVWSNSTADGGAGDDQIYAAGEANVSGGTGDDTISVGVNSTVNFAAGDGKDTVYAGLNTTVKLGEGLSQDKTHVAVSGNTATITFDGSDDQITVNLGPRGPATLAFADGSTMEIQPETNAMRLSKTG